MGESAYHSTDYSRFLRTAIENEAKLQDPTYKNELKKYFLEEPPMSLEHELIDQHVNGFAKKIRDLIEDACVRALLSNQYGVKVVTNLGSGAVTIETTNEVPFGEIHYHTEEGPTTQFGYF